MKGKIVEWHDSKGYGFIASDQIARRIFVHISAINHRNARPKLNDNVIFEMSQDPQNRIKAKNVTVTRLKAVPPTVLFGGAYLACMSVSVFYFDLSFWLIPIYLFLSGFTYLAYARDKQAAQKGKQRIRENTLHLLALFGGWPGALIAQHQLRHKSQKQPFKTILWMTVTAHCCAVVWMVTPSGSVWVNQILNELSHLV